MTMRILAAIVEAILAAAVVGALEGIRVLADAGAGGAGAGAALASWAVISGVAGAGALAAAAVLAGALAALARVPAVAAWRRDLAAGGAARAIAAWRAGLLTGAMLAVGTAVFAIARWSHDAFRFLASGPVGLLVACIVTPLAAAAAAAALAIDRRVTARLGRGGRAAAALDGRRIWIAAALATAAIAAIPPLATHLAAPEIQLEAIAGAAQLVAAVVAIRAAGAGRRRGARIAACAAGVLGLASAERARGALVVHGAFSRAAARAVWSIADRDGDGYPPASVGGADCDDADPRRHPTAPELAGNGIDENCTGSDAPAAALAPRAAPRPPSFPAPRRNIVLITIDALRADRLGAYGHGRPTSPSIDAFAASATRFAWALTPCPATRCAIPALFTGRLPSVADGQAPTLASVLRDAGWETAAISCCERFALGQRDAEGFVSVDVSPDATRVRRAGQSNADVVADTALRWLARRGGDARPFLLWLHFYDPHHPYAAPEAPTRFGRRDLDRYDAEIAYVDRHVGRVLAALDPRTTIAALAADHGEEFGEHGTRFHARSLFNQLVRVPLMVRYPDAPAHVVSAPVSLVDLMPTLLDLAGVAGPAGMNGRSLAASIRAAGVEPPAQPVLMELVPDNVIWRNVAAIAYDGWKVIWDRDANAWSLFSLTDDPADRRDRAADDPAMLAALRRRLLDTLDRELALPP